MYCRAHRGRAFPAASSANSALIVVPSIISGVPSAELDLDLRHAVRDLFKAFPDSYWRELDVARAYPDAFVKALTEVGYLAALIPEEYGGSGLGVAEASIILEE